MSNENDREQHDWLDPRGYAGSRKVVVSVLEALGYEVEADDLESIAMLVRKIVDEGDEKRMELSSRLAAELEAHAGVPASISAIDTIAMREAFNRMARPQAAEVADDGLIDEPPTRSTHDAVGIEQVLAWANEHDAESVATWDEISRKEPDVEHLTGYLRCAIDALPRQDGSWISRLLGLINSSSSLPVAKVFIDHVVMKNSGRCTFSHGHDRWKMDFVAGADYLVLIIADDDSEQPLQTQVATDNPESFSEDVLKAFHGRSSYARVAMESLVETLEMPNGGRRRLAH